MPTNRYFAGILNWIIDELKTMVRITRKHLTLYEAFPLRFDADPLYVDRSLRGKGLNSIYEKQLGAYMMN